MLPLKPPQRPRSLVTTKTSIFRPSRFCNSEWAKRLYVRFKRKHPNKGRWADWGMRRLSARRREERLKRAAAEGGDAPVAD